MLNLIGIGEYRTLIDYINDNLEQTKFKSDFSMRKNHKDMIVMTMTSEDGDNNLQGFISAEIFEQGKGLVANIDAIWLHPNLRETNKEYGEILVFHLINSIKEKYDIFLIKAIGNEYSSKFFTENGFEITSGCGTSSIRFGKFL